MSATHYSNQAIVREADFLRDMAIWNRLQSGDNSQQLAQLRRKLRLARQRELTPRQAEILRMRFEQGMKVTQIAHELGVNKSTISRTITRGKGRLRRCLEYSL